jgi:hypothetical protein
MCELFAATELVQTKQLGKRSRPFELLEMEASLAVLHIGFGHLI